MYLQDAAQAGRQRHFKHAIVFLDKALNKIEQQRPQLRHNVELQQSIDEGGALFHSGVLLLILTLDFRHRAQAQGNTAETAQLFGETRDRRPPHQGHFLRAAHQRRGTRRHVLQCCSRRARHAHQRVCAACSGCPLRAASLGEKLGLQDVLVRGRLLQRDEASCGCGRAGGGGCSAHQEEESGDVVCWGIERAEFRKLAAHEGVRASKPVFVARFDSYACPGLW